MATRATAHIEGDFAMSNAAQKPQQQEETILRKLRLQSGSPSRILVKFNFSWKIQAMFRDSGMALDGVMEFAEDIPAEIVAVPRGTDAEEDQLHAQWILENLPEAEHFRAEIRRLREDRVDTGDLVIQARGVHLSTLRVGFRNNGYALQKVYKYNRDAGRTVAMEFVPVTDMSRAPEIPRNVVEYCRMMANMAHDRVWVYYNLDGTMTVNTSGIAYRQPKKGEIFGDEHLRQPQYAMVVRDHILQAEAVTRNFTEEEESRLGNSAE